jgi:hypothetical protein
MPQLRTALLPDMTAIATIAKIGHNLLAPTLKPGRSDANLIAQILIDKYLSQESLATKNDDFGLTSSDVNHLRLQRLKDFAQRHFNNEGKVPTPLSFLHCDVNRIPSKAFCSSAENPDPAAFDRIEAEQMATLPAAKADLIDSFRVLGLAWLIDSLQIKQERIFNKPSSEIDSATFQYLYQGILAHVDRAYEYATEVLAQVQTRIKFLVSSIEEKLASNSKELDDELSLPVDMIIKTSQSLAMPGGADSIQAITSITQMLKLGFKAPFDQMVSKVQNGLGELGQGLESWRQQAREAVNEVMGA